MAVTLANCPGCTVLATRADVAGGYSAALVDTGAHRAALVSVSAGGEVGRALNVPYGADFPAPAGGALPCDSGGRCIVLASTTEGTAVASAFQLAADGSWSDVTQDGGLVSSTPVARVVDLDGEPGIAVHGGRGDATVWVVYAWGGDGYGVVGCAPAGPDLDPSALSAEQCPS
ncbi:hypothetical protein [Nakamurella endophytica]|uniref:Uncharacterized protein n=1 Tax=Nakamurella endophytica TaxID=1748367 RepID=A0A917WBG3_9ACTN|nr:hypothetical protein [Nakamurella endophytica]GGL90203.1 hypothetical protein GCM10011594_07340 [Nakamurella endophytica]